MARDKTRDLRKMNRRNFVKSLSAMGVSAGALRYMSKETLAKLTDDPRDEVPRLQAMRRKHSNWQELEFPEKLEREPVYYTIPRDDWVRVESTQDAASRINKVVEKEFGKRGDIHVGASTVTDGHHAKKAVKVVAGSDTIEELREKLPGNTNGEVGRGKHKEVVEDIPVVIKEVELVQHQHVCDDEPEGGDDTYYDEDYNNVPAGAEIDDGGGSCTSGTPAWDFDRDELVMLTAAHCVEDLNSDDGDTAYEENHWNTVDQPSGGTYMGPSDKLKFHWDDSEDIATIVPAFASQPGPSYRLADADGGEDEPIWGTIGWDCIKDMEDNNAPYDQMFKQGRTSGRCAGEVTSALEGENGHKDFWTDAWNDSGDSGGPNFVQEDDHVLIAGIQKKGLDGGGDIGLADAAEYAEDAFNLSI